MLRTTTNQQLSAEINDNDFNAMLDQMTGYRSAQFLPTIKFKADEGKFYKSEGEKGEDGKPIYTEIGEKIVAHIVRWRKMVQTDRKAKEQLHSKEYDGNYVELVDEKGNLRRSGEYSLLKADDPSLVYIQVLYLYVEGRAYRMKLSGSKLSEWFDLLKQGNPAFWSFELSKGGKETNGGVTYHKLNFEKVGPETKENIITRVNEVNRYLTAYNATQKVQVIEDAPFPDEDPYDVMSEATTGVTGDDSELQVENIAF